MVLFYFTWVYFNAWKKVFLCSSRSFIYKIKESSIKFWVNAISKFMHLLTMTHFISIIIDENLLVFIAKKVFNWDNMFCQNRQIFSSSLFYLGLFVVLCISFIYLWAISMQNIHRALYIYFTYFKWICFHSNLHVNVCNGLWWK